jgi:hypothetical protein
MKAILANFTRGFLAITAIFTVIHGVSAQSRIPPEVNSVELNKNANEGRRLFRGRFIIQENVIDPSDLAGSLVMVDNLGQENEQTTWTKVNPQIVTADPEFQNEIIFQSIVDKAFVASANYLIFNASVGAQDKVELIVEDVLRFKGQPYTTAGVSGLVTALITQFRRDNRRYYYVQNVQYTTVKHKTFKKVEGKAQFSGVGFGADGNVYSSTSGFTLSKIVSINYVELEVVPDRQSRLGPGQTIIGPVDSFSIKTREPKDAAGIRIKNLRKARLN